MIKVEAIHQIGEDERGSTYTFDMDRTGEFIVGFRKAGLIAQQHSDRSSRVGQGLRRNL